MLFAIPALTLAGIPPTAGFVAKLALLQAGVGAGVGRGRSPPVVIVSPACSRSYALARVWVRVFWGEPEAPLPDPDPDDELVVGTARDVGADVRGHARRWSRSAWLIAVFAGPAGRGHDAGRAPT